MMNQDQIFPFNFSDASNANKLNGAFLFYFYKLFVYMLTHQAMTSLGSSVIWLQSPLRMKTLMILHTETPTMDTLRRVWRVWLLLATSIGQDARQRHPPHATVTTV